MPAPVSRRLLVCCAALLTCATPGWAAPAADAWPSQPLKIMVGFAAGGKAHHDLQRLRGPGIGGGRGPAGRGAGQQGGAADEQAAGHGCRHGDLQKSGKWEGAIRTIGYRLPAILMIETVW